jgi:tetratricopeptide (TPR) repeat protein
MSTINEALKKAQKESDTHHLLYSSILSIGSKRKHWLKKKYLAWFIIPILLVIGALASDAWLNKNNSTPSSTIEAKDRPVRINKRPPAVSRKNLNRLYDRARSFHGKGQLKLAKRFYHEVLLIDPGHSNALNNLGVIALSEKDFIDAEKHFTRALRSDSGSVDPYYNLACLYALKGDISQGIDNLKKAIHLDEKTREWAKKDTDLDNLRGTIEYKALVHQ